MKYEHSFYSLNVYARRDLWEEWMLTHHRPVYRYWGNPELFYRRSQYVKNYGKN